MLCLVVKMVVTLLLIKRLYRWDRKQRLLPEVERVKLVELLVGTIICHSYSRLSALPSEKMVLRTIPWTIHLFRLKGPQATYIGSLHLDLFPKIETRSFSLYRGAAPSCPPMRHLPSHCAAPILLSVRHPSCPKCDTFAPPAKIYFFGQVKRFWGFLGRCDQNETYHTSNGDKIEHMKANC